MVKGQLDISAFPLAYAAGRHPEFDATLMPGLVKNHDHAKRLNDSPFMDDIKSIIDEAGVVVLSDAWLAGGFASKKNCILDPETIKGQVFRAAKPRGTGQTPAGARSRPHRSPTVNPAASGHVVVGSQCPSRSPSAFHAGGLRSHFAFTSPAASLIQVSTLAPRAILPRVSRIFSGDDCASCEKDLIPAR